MHSPEVLVFSIRRPWPELITYKKGTQAKPAWQSIWYKRKDGSLYLSPFFSAFGKNFYFPEIVMVWHMEPGGADSLTICKNKIYDEDGKFFRWTSAWKWHFWHWKISPTFIYDWRRKLLTRCNVCGGRSTKQHPVDTSDSWDNPHIPFWKGETDLHHRDCKKEKRGTGFYTPMDIAPGEYTHGVKK